MRGGISVGGTCTWARRKFGIIPVFLTTDYERLIVEQLTRTWCHRNSPVVLSVNVDGLNIEPEFPDEHDCFTYIIRQAIEPFRVKVHRFL